MNRRIEHHLACILFGAVIAGALLTTGCTPAEEQGGASDASAIDGSSSAFVWTQDTDCAVCHTAEPASLEGSSCLAGIHAAQGAHCATCHTDTAGLEKAHEDATPERAAKYATKLRETNMDDTVCQACHGSYEELAAKTVSTVILTDNEGTVINPHTAKSLNANHEKSMTCASCHAMHTDEPVTETAPAYCTSCHHAGVYQCHTCHD